MKDRAGRQCQALLAMPDRSVTLPVSLFMKPGAGLHNHRLDMYEHWPLR